MMLLNCGIENLELILKIIASEIERTFQKYWRNGQYMAKGMRVSRQQVKWFQPKKFLAGGLSTSFQISLKEKMNTTWNHKKDHALISRLMRKIFPHRRQLLIKDLIPLSGLLQQYPMLCSEEQLSLICYLGLFGSR